MRQKSEITPSGHEGLGTIPRLHGACAERSRSIQNDKKRQFVILLFSMTMQGRFVMLNLSKYLALH